MNADVDRKEKAVAIEEMEAAKDSPTAVPAATTTATTTTATRMIEDFWSSAQSLQQVLWERLGEGQAYNTELGLPFGAREVIVLDAEPPFTKVRVVYGSPLQARAIVALCQQRALCPAQLFAPFHDSGVTMTTRTTTSTDTTGGQSIKFSTRPLQWTRITQKPLPDPSWPRSSPPKFRRLLARLGDGEDGANLEQARQTTRFVFVTNLLGNTELDSWGGDSALAMQALRSVFTPYDTSGQGVEIFVSAKKKLDQYCHVGMRSALDAQGLIRALQDQYVEWKWRDTTRTSQGRTAWSGRLFLDFAAITQRTERLLQFRAQGSELPRGEPSRPECTSTTDHISVPGLILVENFVSEEEEASLMAVILGPHAPWAPSQGTPTEGGVVKRCVQHYGYVFDYETANVLRDRSQENANCPLLPVLHNTLDDESSWNREIGDNTNELEDTIRQSIEEGRGWNVLAGIIERTRCAKFRSNNSSQQQQEGEDILSFPNINQLTVNHYAPGEGIGSHVDTPSAFGDGLLSCSLNGGIVMEFRKVSFGGGLKSEVPGGTETTSNEEEDGVVDHNVKKQVYLPPRSLLILSGPSRYEWEHMIVTRRTDCVNGKVLHRKLRVSLTFRTALALDGSPLPRVVSSTFPPTWQSMRVENTHGKPGAALVVEDSPVFTPDCERDHVHAVYDAIATQWHHTRGRRGVLWPGATQFLQRLPPGSIVADIGCGDGKYFPAIWESGSYVIGIDMSRPLLQTCFGSSNPWGDDDDDDENQELDNNNNNNGVQPQIVVPESRRISPFRRSLSDYPAVAVGDCMSVPFRDESCDAAICIAVLHHISTVERRIRCIRELARVVKPGGFINVQAWSMEQEKDSRRKFASEDVFVPFNAQPKYLQLPAQQQEESQNTTHANANDRRSTAQVYAEAYENADYDERKGLVVFQRYCHLYRKGELEEIVAQVKDVIVVESGFECGNFFVILQKNKSS